LVSNLIVGEGNIVPGGGVASRKITSHGKTEFIEEIFPASQKERFQAAVEGDPLADRLNNLWATVDPVGLYGNCKALVEIDDALQEKFFKLPIPRTYIYGEKSLPENAGDIGSDVPNPDDLRAHGIQVGIVPNAGHGQMFDNLNGFVDVLTAALG